MDNEIISNACISIMYDGDCPAIYNKSLVQVVEYLIYHSLKDEKYKELLESKESTYVDYHSFLSNLTNSIKESKN